jgi:hypothetical protein
MVSKSSIPSPLDADGLRRLAEAATPIEQLKEEHLFFGRALIFGRKDFLPLSPKAVSPSSFFSRQTQVRLKPLL